MTWTVDYTDDVLLDLQKIYEYISKTLRDTKKPSVAEKTPAVWPASCKKASTLSKMTRYGNRFPIEPTVYLPGIQIQAAAFKKLNLVQSFLCLRAQYRRYCLAEKHLERIHNDGDGDYGIENFYQQRSKGICGGTALA